MNQFWNQLSNDNVIQALGWTLLHSLWQGALIAILLALGMVLLRKNSSKIRYFVAASALGAFFLASVITFGVLYWTNTSQKVATTSKVYQLQEQNINTQKTATPNFQVEVAEVPTLKKYQNWFHEYFEQHLPFLVIVWALGVFALMLHFFGAFAYTQRLKYYKTQEAIKLWQIRTKELAEQLGINKSIQLLESALIKTPMVIGFFKPVILVPLGAFAGLSAQQIEGILAHELAHIQRNDYLINLIQSVVEILFFYHPATWWISAQIREERENCCDDIAIELTGDQLTFAKTITALAEIQLQTPALAMAFLGDKSSLTNRVKRLLKTQRPNATFSEGFMAAFVIIALLLAVSFPAKAYLNDFENMALAFSGFSEKIESEKQQEERKNPKLAKELKNNVEKPALNPGDTIRFGQGFMLITKWDGSVEVFKDGELIEEEDYEQYSEEFGIDEKEVRIGKKENPAVQISLEQPANRFAFVSDDFVKVFIPEMDIDLPKVMPPVPPMGNFTFVQTKPFTRNVLGTSKKYGDYRAELNEEGEITYLEIDNKEIKPKDISKYPDIEKEIKKIYVFETEEEKARYEEEMTRYEEEMQRYEEEMKAYEKEMKVYGEEMKEWAKTFEFEWNEGSKIIIKDLEKLEALEDISEDIEFLRKEMLKDGLIKKNKRKNNNLSINLDGDVFEIDGVEIPENLKEKYLKIFEDYFEMNIEGGFSFEFHED